MTKDVAAVSHHNILMTAINTTGIGIWCYSRQRHEWVVNPGFCDLLGLKHDVQPVLDEGQVNTLISTEQAEQLSLALKQCLNGNVTHRNFEVHLL